MTQSLPLATSGCWNVIGVHGDTTCVELKKVIHCRNCPIFSEGGKSLFDRPSPSGYREEWTELLRSARLEEDTQGLSVLVFRVGDEWLAVDTATAVEVAPLRPVRRLSRRTNDVFSGLVNIRGELSLCFSLRGLLRIEGDARPEEAEARRAAPRFVVMEKRREKWVFPVDEVHGVEAFAASALGAVPVTVSKGTANYARGVLRWENRSVGYLDDERLLGALRRSLG
jgi:chemotaxis-related protein WspD